MRKAINVIAIFVLVACSIGTGYLLNVQTEVQTVVQTIQMPAASNEVPISVRALPSIQYGEDKRQSLDIYLPPGRGDFPVMFFIHGGAWSSGDKEMYGSVGCFYAKNGYATVVADHRLSPAVKHPAHVEDVAKAFAWTRKHIANYGGNPDKIWLCGHSSGAHLVSLLVTNQKYLAKEGVDRSGIRGVVAISGIYSLGTNISIAGYGHIFPTNEDRRDASPVNFIDKGLPPFLILYADNDITTLGRQARNFHNALKRNGVQSSLHCINEVNHTTVLLDFVTPNRSSKTVLDFMR